MLKLFFNKESKIVYGMEAVGVVFLFLLIVTRWPFDKPILHQIAFFIFIFEYLFIRFFASFRWYNDAGRKTSHLIPRLFPKDGTVYCGIELQFKKALVPTSYIIAVFGLALLAGAPGSMLYFADLLLAIIAHVNVILIYFHLKDNERLPVNHFTHNKHLTR